MAVPHCGDRAPCRKGERHNGGGAQRRTDDRGRAPRMPRLSARIPLRTPRRNRPQPTGNPRRILQPFPTELTYGTQRYHKGRKPSILAPVAPDRRDHALLPGMQPRGST